jgi:hypothetical protein
MKAFIRDMAKIILLSSILTYLFSGYSLFATQDHTRITEFNNDITHSACGHNRRTNNLHQTHTPKGTIPQTLQYNEYSASSPNSGYRNFNKDANADLSLIFKAGQSCL